MKSTYQHAEDTFTGPENKKIFFQRWLPEGEVRGLILIVHGLGEHSRRYQNLIDHLLPENFGFYAPDHIGHGKSEGTPGHIQRLEHLIHPLETISKRIREDHPRVPLFIFGHSMGGLLTGCFLSRYDHPFQGAVLSSPSVSTPDSISPLTVLVGKLLSRLAPRMPLSELDAEQLSRDPRVVEEYQQDPLVFHGKYSARFASELLVGIQQVRADAGDITLPVLSLAGGKDTISPAEETRAYHDMIGSREKTFHLYPELRHELINAPEKDQVLMDIGRWLSDQLET